MFAFEKIDRRMIRPSWGVAVLAGLLLAPPALPGQACPSPAALIGDLGGALAHVRYLADDALEGREAGSAGERCAGLYIAHGFEALGLEPAGDHGGYFQSFSVRAGSRLGTDNILTISSQAYDLGKAWTPYGFSASGQVTAPLLFVPDGVGRTGPPADSTAPDPFQGRVVVVDFARDGLAAGSFQADPHFRTSVAQGRGAAALIFLLGDSGPLPALTNERRPFLRIPVLAVRGAQAEVVRRAAGAGAEAHVVTTVEPRTAEARNVVALLRGHDPSRADQIVIVGAHYDHLGHGGEGSLAPDSHEVHNGADDNASGTAALLEAARSLSRAGDHQRPILFIAFSGEEKGLLGSAYFVANPSVPIGGAVAMINMDMVGRLRDDALTVYGMATAPEWEELVRAVNATESSPFQLALLPDGFGPSDQSSFYGAGIPVLHFFTNTHTEYHRPDDDWQTLNARGLDRVSALVADVTARLAGDATEPAAELTPVEGVDPRALSARPAEETGRGYGPYFGSIPDMVPTEFGVRLTGVRQDSPAARAGLEAGDVIVGFGGQEVGDLYAFTYALRDRQPGDRVAVIIERDGTRLTLYAVLGERR